MFDLCAPTLGGGGGGGGGGVGGDGTEFESIAH